MTAREWVRIDVGLLDDDRFEDLSLELQGVWLQSYLLIARSGDSVKDLDRLVRLLTKQGVADPRVMVAALDAAGWFVESSKGEGITIRGYDARQVLWRGPSDDPPAKAARNAKRPTTRAGRGAKVERGGASVEQRGATHGTTSHSITSSGAPAHEGRGGPPTKLADHIGTFEEVISGNGKKKPGSTS